MRKSAFLMALMASLLVACGSGDDPAFQGGNGTGTASGVASVTLITSSTSILSDGSTTAQISALVRDSNNQFKSGVPVIFSAIANDSRCEQFEWRPPPRL